MRHGMADECRARAFDGDFPASLVVVERESNFESDLVMRNLAVFDMAARLHHFEPANLPQRARRTADGDLYRVLDALFRRARDLDDSVNMVRHRHAPLGQSGEIRSGEFCLIFAHSIPPRPLLSMRPLQISRKRMCWSCLLLLRLSGLNPSNAVVRKERFIVRPIDRGGRIVGRTILDSLAVD